MNATQQPEYMTSHPACVDEVDQLAHLLAEIVALTGAIDDDVDGDQTWHRLGVLVDLAMARPSVREAHRRRGAR